MIPMFETEEDKDWAYTKLMDAAAVIKAQPEHFDMWADIAHTDECGTIACLAGWVLILKDPDTYNNPETRYCWNGLDPDDIAVERRAIDYLRMTKRTIPLFYLSRWPAFFLTAISSINRVELTQKEAAANILGEVIQSWFECGCPEREEDWNRRDKTKRRT